MTRLRRLWRALVRLFARWASTLPGVKTRPPDGITAGEYPPEIAHGPFTVCDAEGTPLAVGMALRWEWDGQAWHGSWFDGARWHGLDAGDIDGFTFTSRDIRYQPADGPLVVFRPVAAEDRVLLVPQPRAGMSGAGIANRVRREWEPLLPPVNA